MGVPEHKLGPVRLSTTLPGSQKHPRAQTCSQRWLLAHLALDDYVRCFIQLKKQDQREVVSHQNRERRFVPMIVFMLLILLQLSREKNKSFSCTAPGTQQLFSCYRGQVVCVWVFPVPRRYANRVAPPGPWYPRVCVHARECVCSAIRFVYSFEGIIRAFCDIRCALSFRRATILIASLSIVSCVFFLLSSHNK